jgi:hypothetical protein
MFDLNSSQLNNLHLESIRKHLAAARLLRHSCLPKRSLVTHLRLQLGDMLIRAGQRLKEAPRRLEAEPASLSSLTIIL